MNFEIQPEEVDGVNMNEIWIDRTADQRLTNDVQAAIESGATLESLVQDLVRSVMEALSTRLSQQEGLSEVDPFSVREESQSIVLAAVQAHLGAPAKDIPNSSLPQFSMEFEAASVVSADRGLEVKIPEDNVDPLKRVLKQRILAGDTLLNSVNRLGAAVELSMSRKDRNQLSDISWRLRSEVLDIVLAGAQEILVDKSA